MCDGLLVLKISLNSLIHKFFTIKFILALMQGQRGSVGPLPETLDFDLGTPSNNAAMDQQICWNSMRNPAENRMPDYLISPSDMNIALVNSMSRDRQNLSRWCLNEASSSNTHGETSHDERKTELGWPSSSSGPRLEEQRHEAAANNSSADNNVNLMFAPSSNPDTISSSLNLGFVGRSSGNGNNNNSQAMEFPNAPFKFGGSENEQSRSSDPFLLPSGSAGFMVGENDGRQEGRRMSCKRKAIEGNVGSSSSSGSCSYFQNAEGSSRPGLPAQNNAGSNISVYGSLEPGNPRLELGGVSVTSDRPESSHRNFRLRTNPSNQQNPVSPPIFSIGRNVRRSSVLPSQPSPSLLQVAHSLDLRPPSAIDNMRNPSQPAMIDVSLPQNVQPLRWNGASTSRNGSSSSSVSFGERDVTPREDLNSRSLPRNMSDHPIFAPAPPDFRNVVRHPSNRSLAGGGISIPGNAASTSRAGPSSNVHPSSAPAWPPHHNSPPINPRRFSEYLRRSLFSSVGTESGGQSGSYLPLRPGQPGSSQEMVLPPGVGNQGHHQSHPRSASWMERHSEMGIHYSLRSLGAAGEGSSRLVSEQIRSVLGLMRRGENLRFEDVMILDPSVFVGMADIHDRHRDMRLDVDSMTYEELLALEERIGNVSTGLTEEMILKCLKQKKYSAAGKSQSENEPCSVCQEDYNEGEDVGTLVCGHDFHRECIKQWLTHKNLCPICKTTALQT